MTNVVDWQVEGMIVWAAAGRSLVSVWAELSTTLLRGYSDTSPQAENDANRGSALSVLAPAADKEKRFMQCTTGRWHMNSAQHGAS